MALRLTEEEYAEMMRGRQASRRPLPCVPPAQSGVSVADMDAKPKRSKYGNQRVEVDGIRFDSKHEATVYQELLLHVKTGALRHVLRQVSFDLPGGIRYVADFVTITPDMRIGAVIDAKSAITRKNRVYINKKKQMKAVWGIEIVEV